MHGLAPVRDAACAPWLLLQSLRRSGWRDMATRQLAGPRPVVHAHPPRAADCPLPAQVTDESRKFYFAQRKAIVTETKAAKQVWQAETQKKRDEFLGKVKRLIEASQNSHSSSLAAKKGLLAQRKQAATEMKLARSELDTRRLQNQEAQASVIKQAVNDRVSDSFVAVDLSRRMLQHPHYAEVASVAADPTSAISREIAAAPRRRRPPALTGTAGVPASLK